MNESQSVLVINPGSTSLKIALYKRAEGDEQLTLVFEENISHSASELAEYDSVLEQLEWRKKLVIELLNAKGVELETLSCVVGRGGPVKPLAGGTYRVCDKLLQELKNGGSGEHASLLGGIIARELADSVGLNSYVADPVTVDELMPEARLSGYPQLPRTSLAHALNVKAVARKYARERNTRYEKINVIVAHLGGGITVSAHRRGKMIDVNNALDEGPFTPERSGTLPITGLLKLAKETGEDYPELRAKFVGRGGMYAYLGTTDAREVEARIAEGDKEAELVYRAMALQVAKSIGACAVTLAGDVDAVLLTGGVAHSKILTELIIRRVSFLADVKVVAGSLEMEALASHGLDAENGKEPILNY